MKVSCLRLVPVQKHLVLVAEILVQEGVDEGDIVVDTAYLEDLLPAEPGLAVPPPNGVSTEYVSRVNKV